MVERLGQVIVLEMVYHAAISATALDHGLQLHHVIVLCMYHQRHAQLPGPDENLEHVAVADFSSFICHVDLYIR